MKPHDATATGAGDGTMFDMTAHSDKLFSHKGHRHHPDYARLLAEYVAWVTPVLTDLEAHGWREVTPDPSIDCSIPEPSDCLELYADVPAGEFGYLTVKASVVLGRRATVDDFHRIIGAARLYDTRPVLIAAELDPSLVAPKDAPTMHARAQVTVFTPDQVGISPAAERGARVVSALEPEEAARQAALDVISMAQAGGMPNSFWGADARIGRACVTLGITPAQAREMDLSPKG